MTPIFEKSDRVEQRSYETKEGSGIFGVIIAVDRQAWVTYSDGEVRSGDPINDRYLIRWDTGDEMWHYPSDLI